MKRLLFSFVAVSVSLFGWSQNYEPTDAGSSVTFKIMNSGKSVEGALTGLKGVIQFDPHNLSASLFDVAVDPSSVDTRNKMRNNHLKKGEYFDIQNFPEIRFTSRKIEAGSQSGKFTVTGKLTMKKATKEIKFDFTAREQGDGYLFQGEFPINRRDYGVGGSCHRMADELKVFLSVTSSIKQK